MPKYLYRCSKCSGEIEIWHSMSSKIEDCESCNTVNSLVRVPASFTTAESNNKEEGRVGDLVKSSIEDFRKDLKDEKKRIKEEFYKP